MWLLLVCSSFRFTSSWSIFHVLILRLPQCQLCNACNRTWHSKIQLAIFGLIVIQFFFFFVGILSKRQAIQIFGRSAYNIIHIYRSYNYIHYSVNGNINRLAAFFLLFYFVPKLIQYYLSLIPWFFFIKMFAGLRVSMTTSVWRSSWAIATERRHQRGLDSNTTWSYVDCHVVLRE